MRCCSAPSMPLVLIAWGVVHDTLYEKGYKATRFKAKALRGMSPGIQRTAEPHEIAQNLSEVIPLYMMEYEQIRKNHGKSMETSFFSVSPLVLKCYMKKI